MKVFVVGATGVLGRRALPRLVAAGHAVTAVARGPQKAALVRSLGAIPVAVDVFDAGAVMAAVAGHDAVCNLATHIPPLSKAARASAWAENNRIRTEVSRHLVDAALAAGVARVIQESITLPYADGGDRWLDEDAPIEPFPAGATAAVAEAEAARFTAAGGTGVVLRFAAFYGAGASHTRAQLRLARQGVAPVLGSADAFQSMVHLDDAAAAVVAALSAPAGVYNVAEDRPVRRSELAAAVGSALGTEAGWMPPALLTRMGGANAEALGRSQRVSNRRFRAATGWAPAHPDPWTGWRQVVAEERPAPRSSPGRGVFVKASLAFLAANAALLGFWATVAPHAFYRGFPGLGAHWVEVDGPFNAHLASDVGELSLALLVVTVAALGSRHRSLTRTAGVAWMVSAVPHLAYHVAHRHVLGTADQVASLGGLALQGVLAVAIVVLAPPTPGAPVPQVEEAGVPAPVGAPGPVAAPT